MVKAELWRSVGGFDEEFLPMYYEDVDLCFQAREHGLQGALRAERHDRARRGGVGRYGPTSGHKRHQEENRHKFVRKWKATLDRDHLVPDVASRRFAADRNRRKHVLVVDHRTPMWDRDAGSLRTLRMMESLISLGARVTLLPDNVSRCDPYTTDLERMGIEVMYEPCDVARELAETGASIDFAILSRPHPASHWLDTVREHAPRATVAYDTVDLHWLRESRRGSVAAAGAGSHGRSGVPAAAIVQKSNALRELELAMIRATDITITTTEHERAIVEEEVPGADVLVLPTVYDVAAHVPPFEGRNGILFLGGFEHAPMWTRRNGWCRRSCRSPCGSSETYT